MSGEHVYRAKGTEKYKAVAEYDSLKWGFDNAKP